MVKTLAHLEKDPTARVQFFTGPLGKQVPDVNSRTRLVIRNSDGARLGMVRCRRGGWRYQPYSQRCGSRKA